MKQAIWIIGKLVFCHSQELGWVVVDEATSPCVFLINRTRELVDYRKSKLDAALGLRTSGHLANERRISMGNNGTGLGGLPSMMSRINWVGLILASFLFSTQVLAGQQSPTENWLGVLNAGAVKLRIQLNLTPGKDGKYTGEMVSPDQSPIGIAMDNVTRTDKKLDFEIKRLRTTYQGKMNDDQSVVTGVFTQGQKFDLVFKRVAEIKPDKHLQTWKGILKAAGKDFDFQFRLFKDGEGESFVKLDSFSEGLMGITCEFKQVGREVTIEIPITKAKFAGTLSEDGQTIDGNWLQSGGKYPLQLTLIPLEQTRSPDLNRPQTPKPPFQYDVTDFSVAAKSIDDSFSPDVVLSGTMTSPHGSGPFATVILITGSGPQDRDETIFEHKPFLVLADFLTRRGFAVIRYDDRGIGKSKGDFADSTTADFAEDVQAVVGWAKKQPKVDPQKIVLAGHSEGGLIAPLVASRSSDIAGIILLAGPGVPGNQIVLNQTRKIAAAAGVPANILQMQDNMLHTMLAEMDSGRPITDDFKKTLNAAFDGLSEEERAKLGMEDIADKTIAAFESTWMRYFLQLDPRPALKKTSCPILSVIGEKDLQVDPDLNFPEIEAAVKAGKNSDFVQKELPGLNHLFQKAKTGSPGEYIQIEETMDPTLLNEVAGWLEKRFK